MKALAPPVWDLNVDSDIVKFDRRIVIPGEFSEPVVSKLSEISVFSMFNEHSVRKIALKSAMLLFKLEFFKLSY